MANKKTTDSLMAEIGAAAQARAKLEVEREALAESINSLTLSRAEIDREINLCYKREDTAFDKLRKLALETKPNAS